jgi:hypothetical protein
MAKERQGAAGSGAKQIYFFRALAPKHKLWGVKPEKERFFLRGKEPLLSIYARVSDDLRRCAAYPVSVAIRSTMVIFMCSRTTFPCIVSDAVLLAWWEERPQKFM